MDLENLFPSRQVWAIDRDMSIESARSHECWIQRINTIRPRQHNNMFRCSKPIHLYKDLIQRLFPLIIAHTKFPPIPRFSNRIDFVDKDNRRLMTSCLSEQITYTRCSYTNKHFDKLGPRDRKEGDSSFARRSFCKECFSCSGW